ncbi:MAG: type II secretion system protein [Kiritimatiellae bacterium]|nr:type II secretion system protein [Kiritimatiellia bacterium]
MKRAFTLLELLLVMAIMGMMGSVTVGAYRSMQRGMEERGVMQNVNQFLKSAYSRAQIDRRPVVVYLWNETIAEEKENQDLVVVGHAVAVRPFGRITGVQGNFLYDEFGDLQSNAYVKDIDDGSESQYSGRDEAGNRTYIYKVDTSSAPMRRTLISQTTKKILLTEPVLGVKVLKGGNSQNSSSSTASQSSSNMIEIPVYCYVKSSADQSGVTWETGDAYGFEFQELTLPHNYIFGTDYSKTEGSPIKNLSIVPRFLPGVNSGSGSSGEASDYSFEISAIRPNKQGEMATVNIGKTVDPREAQ